MHLDCAAWAAYKHKSPCPWPFHALYLIAISSSSSSSSSTTIIWKSVPPAAVWSCSRFLLHKKEFFYCSFRGQALGFCKLPRDNLNCNRRDQSKVELNWNSHFPMLKPQEYWFRLTVSKVGYVRGLRVDRTALSYTAAPFPSTGVCQPFPLKQVQHMANLIQPHASRVLLLSPSTQLKRANLSLSAFL